MKAEDTRDQALERLLRRSFEAGNQADVSPDCLDAEMFATWADGGLHGAALKAVEGHVAGCARCQAMAAVMMRAAPPVPVVLPWWRRSVRPAWLVPLAAGAAAVAVWAVVPSRPQLPSQPEASIAARSEPAEAESKVASQPVAADKLTAGDRRQTADPSTRSARERADSAEGRRPPSLGEGKPSFGGTSRPSVAESKPSFAGTRTAGEKRENEARDQSRRSAPGTVAETVTVTGQEAPRPAQIPAAPAPSAAAASPRSAEEPARARGTAGGLMKQEVFMREIPSPDPAIRWRLGARGLIDRTDDGGKTWTRLSSGVIADLIAGHSPSAPICWVVGRDSTVLRSTDGRNWARVNIPEVADLVGVEAVDATTAVVSASDGRRFRTTSGGQTWIKESPR